MMDGAAVLILFGWRVNVQMYVPFREASLQMSPLPATHPTKAYSVYPLTIKVEMKALVFAPNAHLLPIKVFMVM